MGTHHRKWCYFYFCIFTLFVFANISQLVVTVCFLPSVLQVIRTVFILLLLFTGGWLRWMDQWSLRIPHTASYLKLCRFLFLIPLLGSGTEQWFIRLSNVLCCRFVYSFTSEVDDSFFFFTQKTGSQRWSMAQNKPLKTHCLVRHLWLPASLFSSCGQGYSICSLMVISPALPLSPFPLRYSRRTFAATGSSYR